MKPHYRFPLLSESVEHSYETLPKWNNIKQRNNYLFLEMKISLDFFQLAKADTDI